jgi:hypothetical protein
MSGWSSCGMVVFFFSPRGRVEHIGWYGAKRAEEK